RQRWSKRELERQLNEVLFERIFLSPHRSRNRCLRTVAGTALGGLAVAFKSLPPPPAAVCWATRSGFRQPGDGRVAARPRRPPSCRPPVRRPFSRYPCATGWYPCARRISLRGARDIHHLGRGSEGASAPTMIRADDSFVFQRVTGGLRKPIVRF